MSYFVVDVEADGPCPGLYSMVCFGVVKVDNSLDSSFYGRVRPISNKYDPAALQISGFTREEHLSFPHPLGVIYSFTIWLQRNSRGKPIFISDNPAFDWQWMNYYFHSFFGRNPFGYSARRISDLYCGMQRNAHAKWKHLRQTEHTHNPIDDARGNAEALLAMRDMGLKIDFR